MPTRICANPTSHSPGAFLLTITKRNTPSHVRILIILLQTPFKLLFSVFHLSNKSLPWDYNFRFVIEEISNINDKAQVRKVFSCKTVISSVAVDGDINVLCGVVGGAENGDKRVGGGVERRADWANRRELLTRGDSPLSLSLNQI